MRDKVAKIKYLITLCIPTIILLYSLPVFAEPVLLYPPIVRLTGPTQAIIIWELSEKVNPVWLNYGDIVEQKHQKVKASIYPGEEHVFYKVVLDKLKADAQYWYFIDYKKDSPMFSFRTQRLKLKPPSNLSVLEVN